MPVNSNSLNRKLYDLLSSKGYNPKPLDVEGKVTPVPEEAAVIKFDFIKDGKEYGSVWISIEGAKTLRIYYGDNVSNSPDDATLGLGYDDTWTGLIRHLKNWAQRRQLGFELKNENHLVSDMAQRKHSERLAENMTHKNIEESDISGLLAAAKLNRSFIIKAETAEGQIKKFRVKAQSPNVAKEKFMKHHSMAKILDVTEENIDETKKLTAQQKLAKGLKKGGYDVDASAKFWADKIKELDAQKAAYDAELERRKKDVSEDFSDDLGDIYALHPDAEEAEDMAYRIMDMDEDDFIRAWRGTPDRYQELFGYDIPLWGEEGMGLELSSYPNMRAKDVTFDEYLKIVGDYLRSEELSSGAMNRMTKGIKESKAKTKVDEGYYPMDKQGVAEGYILKKTKVEKTFEPGDPDEYYTSGGADVTTKDTDYEIINNKTGQVVGTASWTTNDYVGPGALKITMKNGATRWLDIWEREKGNPQTAFNRFVKDPKTAKKYKEQGVAEAKDSDEATSKDNKPARTTQTCKICGKKWQLMHVCKGPKNIGKQKVDEGYYPMGKQGSYSDAIPTTKIILQHTRKIEEGEQRYRNIAKIFVENMNGERFLVPTTKPGIARVYARHIAEGGTPYDERGKHITSLVEEYSKMAGFVRATKNKQFNESAQALINEGINHYQSLRETLHKMCGHRGYNAYFESYTPTLVEDEEEQTNLNELFVQETLDPRIESVMPILSKLHKHVAEIRESGELAEWADSLIENSLNEEHDSMTFPAFINAVKEQFHKEHHPVVWNMTKRDDDVFLFSAENDRNYYDMVLIAPDKEGSVSVTYGLVDDEGQVDMDDPISLPSTDAGANAIVEKAISLYHDLVFDDDEEDVEEGLDANQKRAGQLGPTEKVGPKGAVGKLVGGESTEPKDDMLEDIDQIIKLSGVKKGK